MIMKSKRRAGNIDSKMCSKKIMTRNMQNKLVDDIILSVTSSCSNLPVNKPTPKARPKNCQVKKLDSDPYSFSKIDEESKRPIKKVKIEEHNGKDVAVNTHNFGAMTDPGMLGPCEPGTTIALQGIVWLETVTGLLVINVNWRGRTYVGTLLDSTKYRFSPPFKPRDCTGKCENHHSSEPNVETKEYDLPNAMFHTDLRSNNMRHCRRSRNHKKTATLLAIKNSCYLDSLTISSVGDQSDSEGRFHQKYSLSSKTRSITRSLAKQTKTEKPDDESMTISADNSIHLEKCSQFDCYKKFSNPIALSYHLQRCHGKDEEVREPEDRKQKDATEKIVKMEETNTENDEINSRCGKLKYEDDNFKLECHTELKRFDVKINLKRKKCVETKVKSDEVENVSSDLSGISKLSEVSPNCCKTDPTLDQKSSVGQESMIRTVSAPTISSPLQLKTHVLNTDLFSDSYVSLTELTQIPNKPNPPKVSCLDYCDPTSFQVPSSISISKKRPLISVKVALNRALISNRNKIAPNIRSSIPNVASILPATGISSYGAMTTSNSTTTIGPVSSSSKRTNIASNNATSTGMTNALSLKPIQPKPKSTIVGAFPSGLTSCISPTNLPNVSPNQTSYQRQILPSPTSKIDDRLTSKFETSKSLGMKRKRDNSGKKMRQNIHESNTFKKGTFNVIEPKNAKVNNDSAFENNEPAAFIDNYKMTDENCLSPDYSDLSETNDATAPVLEKEMELKSIDCDKLIIFRDLETNSVNRINSSCSEKPPALMPAVLSAEISNGTTIDHLDSPTKIGRRKTLIHKRYAHLTDLNRDLPTIPKDDMILGADFSSSLKHNTASTSKFSSQTIKEPSSVTIISNPNLLSLNSFDMEKNATIKLVHKCTNLSAINDYVWLTKNKTDFKSKILEKFPDGSQTSAVGNDGDYVKRRIIVAEAQPSNGRLSVKATKTSQEMISTTLTTSSIEMSVNSNSRLKNSLFKN